jgi:hypothetical protein
MASNRRLYERLSTAQTVVTSCDHYQSSAWQRVEQHSHLPEHERGEVLEIIVTTTRRSPAPRSTGGCGANKRKRSWNASPRICRGFLSSPHPPERKNPRD